MSIVSHAHPAQPSATACPLWRAVAQSGVRSLAVMGMTKNTGKTVCLNHLLGQAQAAHRTVGLTSIGRDGEQRDQVFAFPKPAVRVPAGCLVATARQTLVRAKVRVPSVRQTGLDSPMGEILIVKALDAGEMEVAGPSRSQDQIQVMAWLQQCGADLVLLDGALGRSHHASPAVAEGVVLSTGAALGGDVPDVLRKTHDRLAILGLQPLDPTWAQRVHPVMTRGGVAMWAADGHCLFNEPMATLNAAATLRAMAQPTQALSHIALAGAVGRQLWRALLECLQRHPGLTVVVGDGTRLFVDASALHAFERQGGRVLAWRSIRLLGVTLNPFSPFGASFDAASFLAAAQQRWPDQVVTDVMCSPREEAV